MKSNIIGNYQILEKIGEGGMGTVYKGVDLNLHRPVAIKILHPHLLSDPMTVDRFRVEARTLANLSHRSVAILYNFLEFEDTYAMVMEYVEGNTLAELMEQEGRLDPTRAISLMEQILDGLHHAHLNGIVHRDVKPSNIIVTSEDKVKVMDFGIARIIGSQRLTRTGTMIGTLQYMAPEQIKGEEGDIEADIYASATVLYELLSGRIPYENSTEFGLIQKKVSESATPLNHVCPEIPVTWSKVVMMALRSDPRKRYTSAQLFGYALANLIDENPEQKSLSTGTSRSLKDLGSRTNIAIGLMGLIVLFVFSLLFDSSPASSTRESETIFQSASVDTRPVQVSARLNSIGLEPTPVPSLTLDSLFRRANAFYGRNQWLEPENANTLEVCQQIIEAQPGHSGAIMLLDRMALVFEEEGDQYERQSLFREAIESYANSLRCSWKEKVDVKRQQLKRRLEHPKLVVVGNSPESQPIVSDNSRLPGPKTKPLRVGPQKTVNKSRPADEDVAAEENEAEALQTIEDSKQKAVIGDTTTEAQDSKTSEKASSEKEKKAISNSVQKSVDHHEEEPISISIDNGQVLTVSLIGSVSSESNTPEGYQIPLKVSEQVMVDGTVVIAAGARVVGQITQSKSIENHSKAVLEIEVQTVQTIDGETLPIKAGTFRIIEKSEVGAYFHHNQQFIVKIDGEHTLQLTK